MNPAGGVDRLEGSGDVVDHRGDLAGGEGPTLIQPVLNRAAADEFEHEGRRDRVDELDDTRMPEPFQHGGLVLGCVLAGAHFQCHVDAGVIGSSSPEDLTVSAFTDTVGDHDRCGDHAFIQT